MKILAIADVESRLLWEHFDPTLLEGVHLVLSCGDLDPRYLSFIATFTPAPVLYVHGNHDTGYQRTPPEGCVCIEDTVYNFRGLRILGLGGSIRYKPGPFQYTEQEMARRIARLRYKLARSRGFDILLSHAPAAGLNDGPDRAHQGFACFGALMDKYHPAFFVHGHVHMNYGNFPREACWGATRVINAYERHFFTVETPDAPPPSAARRWRLFHGASTSSH